MFGRRVAALLALVLACSTTFAVKPAPAAAADNPTAPEFVQIRANWRWMLTGGNSNPADPATAAAIAAVDATAARWNGSMITRTSVKRAGADWLTSDKQASVLVQITGSTVQVAVSDPTQLNTGKVTISVDVPVKAKASGDARIAQTSASGQKLTFTVNVDQLKGGTASATFTR